MNQAARIGDVEWLKGMPGWVRTDKFTIEAKAEGNARCKGDARPDAAEPARGSVQAEDPPRTDEQPLYVMTVAKGGLKIAPESCTEAIPPTRRRAKRWPRCVTAGSRCAET